MKYAEVRLKKIFFSGKPRGFEFVKFETNDAFNKILLEKEHIINNKKLDVETDVPKQKIQQQGFGNNPNNFAGMNNPFNLPASSGTGGYNVSSISTPFDNFNSYRITSQNYGDGNYNNMPHQQSRGGGPMCR